jgi:hypothetical protein
LKAAYSHPIDFDPNLMPDTDVERCKEWLRKLCRDFGLGFHPDTPASDYVNTEGLPLPPDVASALEDSLKRVFEILGDELPYVLGAEVATAMLAELSCQRQNEHPQNSDFEFHV